MLMFRVKIEEVEGLGVCGKEERIGNMESIQTKKKKERIWAAFTCNRCNDAVTAVTANTARYGNVATM